MKQDKYMGMDVHRATTVVIVLDHKGKLVLETIVATEAAAIIRLMESRSGPVHVTFEETSFPGPLTLRFAIKRKGEERPLRSVARAHARTFARVLAHPSLASMAVPGAQPAMA